MGSGELCVLQGNNALLLAAAEGHKDVVELLGGNPDHRMHKNKQVLCHVA